MPLGEMNPASSKCIHTHAYRCKNAGMQLVGIPSAHALLPFPALRCQTLQRGLNTAGHADSQSLRLYEC